MKEEKHIHPCPYCKEQIRIIVQCSQYDDYSSNHIIITTKEGADK